MSYSLYDEFGRLKCPKCGSPMRAHHTKKILICDKCGVNIELSNKGLMFDRKTFKEIDKTSNIKLRNILEQIKICEWCGHKNINPEEYGKVAGGIMLYYCEGCKKPMKGE